MSIHKLTPAAVTRAVRQAYIAAVWNAVALLVGALFLIWKLESRWTVLFGIGPIILMMVWNSMRRAEAVYRAYEIEMDEQGIARKHHGADLERVQFVDVGSAVDVRGEGIIIRSVDGRRRVAISEGVADYPLIRQKIASTMRIEPAPRKRRIPTIPGAIALSVGTMVAVITFLTSNDPLITAVMGVVLVGIFGAATLLLLRGGVRSASRLIAALLMLGIAGAIAARIYAVMSSQ